MSATPEIPRGIRNHNPFNLDYIAPPDRPWNGQIGSDGRFGIYLSPDLGVRAGSKQLQKDFAAMGTPTLAQLITEWAPPTENDTPGYIAEVSSKTGIAPDAPFDLLANLPALAEAMIERENGQQPYAASDIATWVFLA